MQWSPLQDKALRAVAKWLADPRSPQVFIIYGYAGTGKTTLAKQIAADAGGALFCAFTGKASLVLRKKGCLGASTIHSLIYKPQDDLLTGETTFVLNPDSPVANARLVIADEVSMVYEELGADLLSFGTKVLVLGDPFQLPPVKGEGYFASSEPDIMLTEIHRQAAESAIIRLSMDVREGRGLTIGDFGDARVIMRSQLKPQDVLDADQVLVGLNRTRRSFNARIRQLKGIVPQELFSGGTPTDLPVAGDRLVCLKNNRTKALLNGSLWMARNAMLLKGGKIMMMNVASLDDPESIVPVDVETPIEYFRGQADELPWPVRKRADEFDFGYALTVHKSQGSQFDNVMLFDESSSFREHAPRHLYTGLTRAAEYLTVVMT